MTDPNVQRKEVMYEIMNRKKMGDKMFHSETSLQNLEADNEVIEPTDTQDPGVTNTEINRQNSQDVYPERRRTMSQPGPISGALVTASAVRAARKRPLRSVAYTDDYGQMPRNTANRDGSGTATPTGENGAPFFNGGLRNGDAKSLNSYRLYASANDLRVVGPLSKRSVGTIDAQSLRSIETHAPPPTSPEDNKRMTRTYLTLVLSCIYATILVTLGLLVYISGPIIESDVAIYFSLVLCIIGMTYHLYLLIDIGRYKGYALRNQRLKAIHEEKLAEYFRKQEEEYMNTPVSGDRSPNNRERTLPPTSIIPLKHDYCFSSGRHSGSFFLKMGAAAFAMGHLIHTILLIAMQVGQLFDESVENDGCVSIPAVVLDVVSPCYNFLQLYFVFKYSNVIILKHQGLAHLAIMHVIASSICFWLSAIVRETVLGLTLYANTAYSDGYSHDAKSQRFLDVSGLANAHCDGSTSLIKISQNFSPYLYPFTVEFNILIVAIYYIIWSQIGTCPNEEISDLDVNSSIGDNHTVCKIPTAHEDNDYTSNIVIHADCHASNRGLFLGMILIVAVAGMLIIGYVFSSVGGDFLEVGYLLNDCTMLSMHVILLFTAVIAFNQIQKLDINEHPISLLDDVLLFICLPAFALETILSLVATISLTNAVKIANYVVMAIQVLVQTPLIMDGLRRCSNAKNLRRTKPGRELLMFLIIANVGMWLFYTFSYKSSESLDERYAYYGKVLWSILGHISLPLIMFYRFHSSVCFADIWDSAYKTGSEH